MHNILVLGGSGLVGKAIISEMSKNKELQIYATYFENPLLFNQDRSFKLSIQEPANISSILNKVKPQSVVSCLRGDYSKQLILHTKTAQYLKTVGGTFYFFSTTNVFDNDLSRPHYEEDLPNSCTDYGQYKITCENRILEILQDKACILRLPQVWGKDSSRMNALLNSLQHNEKIVIYPKLLFNSTTDIFLAKQLYFIIENNLKGIFHLSAKDVVNQKEFYEELIHKLNFTNIRFQENFEEVGYFALLSRRHNEFPEWLRFMNKSVIDYLKGNK